MFRRSDRRGANAIEFALTLPVFLLFVSGVFDFSWYAFQRTILKNAASMGCRSAALVDPGYDDVDLAAVRQRGEEVIMERIEVLGGIGVCGEDCDISIEVLDEPPGRIVQCSVKGTWTPIWGMHLSELPIAAHDIERLAWQRWPADS